jgi:hypothetical protein
MSSTKKPSLFERHLEEKWTPELMQELEQSNELWTYGVLADYYRRQGNQKTAASYYVLASLCDSDVYSWLMNEIPSYGNDIHQNMSEDEFNRAVQKVQNLLE